MPINIVEFIPWTKRIYSSNKTGHQGNSVSKISIPANPPRSKNTGFKMEIKINGVNLLR
jgi:hypothetical protein